MSDGNTENFLKFVRKAVEFHNIIMQRMGTCKRKGFWNSDMDVIQENITSLGKLILKERGWPGANKISLMDSSKVLDFVNVKVGEDCCGIASENVFEVVYGDDGNTVIHDVESCLILGYRDRLLPLIHLGQYLNPLWNEDGCVGDIVIVKTESYFFALLVDNVGEMKEAIVNRFDGEKCFGGVALTDMGEVRLILDIDEIGRSYKIEKNIGSMESNKGGAVDGHERFLLFDLGEHKNYGVPLEDVRRIESVSIEKVSCQKQNMPVIRVAEMLGFGKGKHERHVNILVVERGGKSFSLLVGKVLGMGTASWEVDSGISDREGILGVVILEDRIVSVINMEFLLRGQLSHCEPHKRLMK